MYRHIIKQYERILSPVLTIAFNNDAVQKEVTDALLKFYNGDFGIIDSFILTKNELALSEPNKEFHCVEGFYFISSLNEGIYILSDIYKETTQLRLIREWDEDKEREERIKEIEIREWLENDGVPDIDDIDWDSLMKEMDELAI